METVVPRYGDTLPPPLPPSPCSSLPYLPVTPVRCGGQSVGEKEGAEPEWWRRRGWDRVPEEEMMGAEPEGGPYGIWYYI